MTADPQHVPVLVERCVALLAPALREPGAVLVDGTLGLGGHSSALLEELPGSGGVLAVEWAERLRRVPWRRALRVLLRHGGEDVRQVRVEEAA